MKALIAALFLLTLTLPAHARDGYADNGRPLVCSPVEYEIGTSNADTEGFKRCVAWISAVKQPSGAIPEPGQEPTLSSSTCCGEADAYIADEWEQDENGGWVAIISRDYPAIQSDDGEGGTVSLPAVPKGTRIPIPKLKIDIAHQGNPTGHGIVFFNWSGNTPNVLCYFTKTLT